MSTIINHFRTRATGLGIAVLLLVNSCSVVNSHTHSLYDINYINRTGRELSSIVILFNGRTASYKLVMSTSGGGSDGPIPLKIPAEAEVRWVSNGQQRSFRAKLAGIVPNGFDEGGLYFIFKADDTVEVRAIRFNDTAALDKLNREDRPYRVYSFGFVNKTSRDLPAISLYYGPEKVGSSGSIPMRVKIGYIEALTNTIPSVVELRWKANGSDHVVKVKLGGVVPKDYDRGIIYCVMRDGDKVEVRPIKVGDDKARGDLVTSP